MTNMVAMFCLNLATNGGNQTKAAIDAGYAIGSAAVRASELMRRDDVKKRVAELRAKQAAGAVAQKTASRNWVLSKLVEEAEQADKASERIQALKLVGDSLGMFVSRTMEIQSPLDGLSADELTALLRLAEELQEASGRQLAAKAAPGSPRVIEATAEPEMPAIEAETSLETSQPSVDDEEAK